MRKQNSSSNTSNSKNPRETIKLKIALIGKSLVGKSAITNVFVSSKFPSEYDTTIEDKYTVERFISNYPCSIDILDTAGQDDYYTLIDNWINSSDGFILVFSITDKESFEVCKSRYERIKLNKGSNFRLILAGNKADCAEKRTVSYEDAKSLAAAWETEYIECSAKNMVNIEEAFLKVSEKLLGKILKKDLAGNGEEEKRNKCFCF
jgi:GTPase KRas protein